MPSLPTTAISADAPFSITYSSDTMEVVGKVHVAQRRARLVQHLAERHVDALELGEPALPLAVGQRASSWFLLGSG